MSKSGSNYQSYESRSAVLSNLKAFGITEKSNMKNLRNYGKIEHENGRNPFKIRKNRT